MRNFARYAVAGVLISSPISNAIAQEFEASSPGGELRLSGSSGVQYLQTTEMSYYSNGVRLSQLDWSATNVIVHSGEIQGKFDGWVLRASGSIGSGGNGHMVDRDWISPYSRSADDGDWSHRSIHPGTKLDHFRQAGFEIGHSIYDNEQASIDVTAGFKQTDIQWTAWGGSYVYSTSALRDTSGNFDDTMKGITYRQKLPVAFIGVDGYKRYGAWNFGGKIQVGATVKATGVDNHWQRNLVFTERYAIAPTLSLGATAEYNFTSNISAFAGANFDGIFRAKGDTTIYNTVTKESSTLKNVVGSDFMSAGVTLGVRGKF